MSVIQISGRYAEAVFALAKEQGVLDDVYSSLMDIGSLIHQIPQFKEFLANPLLSSEERHKVLAAMFEGKVPALVFKFLLYVSLRNRLDLLAHIGEAFDELYLQAHNRVRALVQTTLPLDKEQGEFILGKLGQRYSKEIVADYQVKEGMIGGFRIFIKGNLHDFSFTSQLENFMQKVLS